MREKRTGEIGGRVRIRLGTGGALIGLCLSTVGCSIQAGTSLDRPSPMARPLPATAWIETARITDPEVSAGPQMKEEVTASIVDYVQAGNFFRAVKTKPGTPAPDDYVLQFSFDHFLQLRRIHPLYVPLAFITATLYIWVGGPIVIDDIDLSGTLTIATAARGTLVTVQGTPIESDESKSLYASDYPNGDPQRRAERTKLIADLITKALAELAHGKGASQ